MGADLLSSIVRVLQPDGTTVGTGFVLTDDGLVATWSNDVSGLCEPGARSDFRRGTYSGRMQAWGNCRGNPEASFVTLSAAPEGRECVVVLQVGMIGEEGVQAGQRVLDTFEVDCEAVAS